jgi:HSP20 family molecular chaperone IbpA
MTDDTDDDRPRDLFDRLVDLIEALDDIDVDELERRRGRLDRDDISIDYDYDVRVGIGGDRDSEFRPRRRDQNRPTDVETVDVDDIDVDTETYHVDVQTSEDELTITADLPGVNKDDVDVTVEDGAVVLTADGETVHRVPVTWDAGTVTDISFNNNVLVVHITATGVDDE